MGAVMLQGTGSDVGKSVLVAGPCRAPVNRGLNVLPFKPQNMSNNTAVTVDGGEIGRALALQVVAARVELHTDMNPVLLKPQADRTSQLVMDHPLLCGTRRSTGFSDKQAKRHREQEMDDQKDFRDFPRFSGCHTPHIVDGHRPESDQIGNQDVAQRGRLLPARQPVERRDAEKRPA
ncbi:hypothetical protein J3E64_001324 [Sphingobium sp. OAS761]|nr:hypothetical protein [Sphingobium sp. OAS761]